MKISGAKALTDLVFSLAAICVLLLWYAFTLKQLAT